MARVAMDLCLRVLKKSNKSRFDSYSLGNSVLIISHITFRFCRVHIFCDKLSRNSCIQNMHPKSMEYPCEQPLIFEDEFNQGLDKFLEP